ncbi:hypothetical protein D3C85_917020 [compost metagenome]
MQDGQRADQNVRVNPLLIRAQLPHRQQRQWQQPRLQALPALITRPATDFGGGRVRPVHQRPVQQTDATIHRHTDQADHHNAHEDDVEHEQLACPDHQVADAFAGREQFNSEQRGPSGGQRKAHTGHEGRQRGGQHQAADQQVPGQAQHGGGFAQPGLRIAHADQCVQGHRHHDRLDQHHQFQHFTDAEKHHEQGNPGQGRDLRQPGEGGKYQALQSTTETQRSTQNCTSADPGQQPPEQALQADPQMAPQLALGQFNGAAPDQGRCRQDLLAHPVVAAGEPPEGEKSGG